MSDLRKLLLDGEPNLVPISIALHELIIGHFPDLEQSVKWGNPCYSCRKNICAIVSHKRQVNLQFFQGAHLKDSRQLSGTGKDMRNLPFKSVDEIKPALVKKLVKQAVAFDQSRNL